MKRVIEDIRNRQFKKVYLLFGDEAYRIRKLKQNLFETAANGDSLNVKTLSETEVSLEEVRDFTDTLPFFAEKRVLLIEDSGLFKGANPEFASWIESLPETAVVIFREDKVDKKTKLYKAVQNTGLAVEINHPTGEDREKFVLREIGAAKVNITKSAFSLLISELPESMDLMKLEIDKLVSYVGPGNAVTEDAVRAIVTPKTEGQVFQIVEAAASGDRKKAFELYYDLLALRTSPLLILSCISRELMCRLRVGILRQKNRSWREIADETGIRDFVVRKMLSDGGRVPPRVWEARLQEALDLESAVKSGDLGDQAAVELILMKLTGNGRA